MTTTTTTKNTNLQVCVKKINGTSFIGVRAYTNKFGEISNQTFNIGISYEKILQDDLKALQNFDIKTLENQHSIVDLTKGYAELTESLQKRLSTPEIKEELRQQRDKTILQSDAQNSAYQTLHNGLKQKDNELYIYGFMVRKTVLVKGNYPIVKSRPLTLAKNAISKAARLKNEKYKNFKVGNISEIRISGLSL